MRIIAGEFRGRKLLSPVGDVTRPITDRVKQSLFDILAPALPGAVVLDLFAGTGSMGLECLSRGAARANFFEADRSAAQRLKQNCHTLGLTGHVHRIFQGDLFRFVRERAQTIETGHPMPDWPIADIAFLDPPYRFVGERPADLQALASQLAGLVRPKGIVVFRHDAGDELELAALSRYDRRVYGQMALEFLTPT